MRASHSSGRRGSGWGAGQRGREIVAVCLSLAAAVATVIVLPGPAGADGQTLTVPDDAPSPTVTIDVAPTLTNDNTPSFEFTSDGGDGTQCRVDNEEYGECVSPYEAPTLTDGEHTFAVHGFNSELAAYGPASTATFTVDTVAPGVTVDSGPADPPTDDTSTFTFSSADPTATTTCFVDVDAPVSCVSPFTPSSLDDGPHVFTVTATDPAGNSSSDSRNFTADTEGPTVSIIGGPVVGETISDTTPTFTFSASEPVASYTCLVDEPISSSIEECTSSFTTGELDPGEHSFQVFAYDELGNVGPPNTVTFTVAEPPVVPAGCDPGDGLACNSIVCVVSPCELTVSNDQTTGIVSSSGSSSPRPQLFAEINAGEGSLTCGLPKSERNSTRQFSRDWLQFFVLNTPGKGYSKRVTFITLEESTESVASLKKATQVCFGAPYRFSPRLGYPRTLVDGEYRAFLPDCRPHPSTPCKVSVSVETPTVNTRRITVVIFVPSTKDNRDPRVRRR